MSRKVQAWLGHVRQITIPWYCVAIDFVMAELPATKEGYLYCLTVMCVFTRFPFAIPLKSKEPEELALALFTWVFSFFGFPSIVLSDHDTTLVSETMRLVFERFGVKRNLTLWNRPQSNGHLERFHRYFNETMSIVLPRYSSWVEMLPVVLFAFRNLAQETTGYSPHFLNFGRDALMPIDVSWSMGSEQSLFERRDFDNTPGGFATSLIARLQAAFKLVRKAQSEASEKNKRRMVPAKGGKDLQEVRFKVGDQVYLREDASVHNKVGAMRVEVPNAEAFIPRKWRFKWTGIHEVLQIIGERACEILHKQRNEKLTVHVDALRLHIPFSNDLQDTSQPSKFVVRQNLPPPEGCNVWFTDEHGTGVNIGDLMIARKPEFEEQEFVMVRKVSATQYQWYGYNKVNYFLKLNLDSFETLAQTHWNPGWWWPEQNLPSYEYTQPRNTIPFLVDIADFATEPIVWGFQLKSNRRLSAPLCAWIKLFCDPLNNTRLPK
jgi:transposase InsO family protein